MPAKKWVVRILIGIGAILAAIVILDLIIFVATLSRIPSIISQADQESGFNSPDYNTAHSIALRARDHRPLTEGDMVTLERLSNNPHWSVRGEAVAALSNLGSTPQATKAASIARAKLNDPDKDVRGLAQQALALLKPPDAQRHRN